MKVLTEQEIQILSKLESIQGEFDKLPYHIEREQMEFKKRIDEAKQIVAIRAMLRSGDGLPAPSHNKEIEP